MKLDISLYIPVYNGESTIERVLKSALNLDPGPSEIIVINDGSKDKTSKALEIFKKPIIELHISNIYKREEFRQKSLISNTVTGGIFGSGSIITVLVIEASEP